MLLINLFIIYIIYAIIFVKSGCSEGNMSETVNFSNIFIGTPDGETESQNEKFEELFCNENNKYSEIISSPEKFMIIGSKGSGKTYLAHYICKKSKENQNCKIVQSQDFLLDKLTNLSCDESESGYVYALCKWFLLDKIARYLLPLHPIKSKIKYTALNELYKFIKKYDNDDSYRETKITTTKYIQKEKGNNIDGSVVIGKENKTHALGAGASKKKTYSTSVTIEAERKKFYELIGTFEKKIIKAISKNDDIILIFDDLDELDKNICDNPSDNDIIINLIKITKMYNSKYAEKKIKLRLILLLRTDILNKLQMYDTNLSKIKTSCGVELYWLTNNASSPERHPLMNMILHKIKTSCSSLAQYSNKELYNILFPEKIDGKPPLDYLLDYSFGRPRDIITHLNHVIVEFPQNTCFNAVALKEIRKLYSSDFYDELVNQAFFHSSPEYTQECINLVSGVKKVSFTYDTIESYYNENKQAFPNIKDIKNALSFLYKIGVIGNVWTVGGNLHSSWAYRKDSLDDVDTTKKFTIHYALRKKFSI